MISLKEQYEANLAGLSRLVTEDLYSRMLEPWQYETHAELGIILSMLEGMGTLMQTFHWKVNGDSFYGDHLLYQRIYEAIDSQVDLVGEKAVGVGSAGLADSEKIIQAMEIFLSDIRENQDVTRDADNMKDALARRAAYAVNTFIETTDKCIVSLKEKGFLTRGVDNLLAGILDSHESFAYLLKQRVSGT